MSKRDIFQRNVSQCSQKEIRLVGKILALVYEEDKDPVSTWEKAVATALPSFPYSDEVFQASISLT